MSKSRAKGTAAETVVVRGLNDNGYPYVERRTLNGSHDRGDIVGIPGVVIEVKAAKTMCLPLWLRELDAEVENDRADIGVLAIKPVGKTGFDDYLIVMRPAMWLRLMREAGR